MIKTIIILAFALLVTLNSLLITLRANYNAGVLLMWVLSVMLLAYGLFHRQIDEFCKSGIGFVLKIIFLIGASIFTALFIFVAVSGYSSQAQGDEKALIVLGAGLRGEQVGDILRRRLVAALEFWQENPAAVIVVTGGQGPQENIPEALAMKRWLVKQGVPEEKIILEDKSVSTEENLLFAKQLLAEAGISHTEPVAIVTNAFHCYRARQYAAKLGFEDVRTIPASINITALLPSYMREVLALVYMWIFRRQLS